MGAAVLALGILVAIFLPSKPAASESLLLPDGTSVRIVAVTYGTNCEYGTQLGRVTGHLSTHAANVFRKVFGADATTFATARTVEPRLILMLHRSTNLATVALTRPMISAFLADSSGFVSGEESFLSRSGRMGTPIETLSFAAVPRRSSNIQVHFFDRSNGSRIGSLLVDNPIVGNHPEWKPEALPATKRVGDVQFTLHDVITGHGKPTFQWGGPRKTHFVEFGTNHSAFRNFGVCRWTARAVAATNETWVVHRLRVSDSAGNVVDDSKVRWSTDKPYFSYVPGLWPEESAWKLSFELRRSKGHPAVEMSTFRNVPVSSFDVTNRIDWTTNVGGVSVTLDYICRLSTSNGFGPTVESSVGFTHSLLSSNMHLEILTVASDAGAFVSFRPAKSSHTNSVYRLADFPEGAKTVDITFAVSQSHHVDFVVNPAIRTGIFELDRAE